MQGVCLFGLADVIGGLDCQVLIILDKSLIFTVIALEGPAEPRSEPHARALGAAHGYRLELVRAAHGEGTAPATGKRFHVILLLATTTECFVIIVDVIDGNLPRIAGDAAHAWERVQVQHAIPAELHVAIVSAGEGGCQHDHGYDELHC